jgi:hypothetical protein
VTVGNTLHGGTFGSDLFGRNAERFARCFVAIHNRILAERAK